MEGIERDLERCAEDVIARGHATVQWPSDLMSLFDGMLSAHDGASRAQRVGFSFPERNDGFLEFGTEYATERSRPDLCRRFNYWFAHREQHRRFAFSHAALYKRAAALEERVFRFAEDLLDCIGRRLGAPERLTVRRQSYLQLCDYGLALRDPSRTLMQEVHEDGHLITVVKQTAPGLSLLIDGRLQPVRLAASEAVVFAGSLLTEVTDGRIAPMFHAVAATSPPAPRRSLMYFVNPDQPHGTSWSRRRPLDLAALVEAAQTRFGRPARG